VHLENEEQEWPEDSESLETSLGERLEFKSVGIDIGSSTSHLMFSQLVLARRGREYFSGYTVIKREIMYRSPVILTPFLSDNTRVDATKLTNFFQQCYEEAGLTPAQIDTGAVITTGEAAKKENTAAIINILAKDAGKFVCAAAGPNMEAVLAAHGSGAVKHSLKHTTDGHETILNVDVGGGTSKVAVVRGGQVLRTCAINVGSRLVAWNPEGILTRVEEAGAQVARSLGLKAEVGRKLSVPEREKLSEKLTDLLFEILDRKPLGPLARSLMITPELGYDGPLDLVVYSGGVAEFVYGEEKGHFGDLGSWLGRSIRERNQKWGISLGLPAERIRATVIGASQYTVQVSGNTIFLSHPELLPLRNLPVIKLPPFEHPVTRQTVSDSVRQNVRLLDLEEGAEKIALGITWNHEPEYQRLRELAEGIKMALPRTLAAGLPIILVFDNDVGKLVGHLLQECGVTHIISIDSISLRQLSYIDIGQQLSTTNAVPVTVKSLIFR
jgi:ethanolamine utilization protein EutA